MKHVCVFLANKEASEVPSVVNLAVIVLLGSSELKCLHYELGTQGYIGSGRHCQLPPKEWSRKCVLLPKKESNVAVTGYCK